MRYWIFMLFLFTAIVFSRVAKAPEADRPVRYDTINTDSAEEAYWKAKSDSLNLARK